MNFNQNGSGYNRGYQTPQPTPTQNNMYYDRGVQNQYMTPITNPFPPFIP